MHAALHACKVNRCDRFLPGEECQRSFDRYRAFVGPRQPDRIYLNAYFKLHVDDVPLLYQKHKEGLIDAPRYLPPQFKDLNGLAVWMSFSSFLNLVDLKRIQEHYDKLFKTHL